MYKASNHAVNLSSSSATLNVPGTPAPGEFLLAILICRGDRSFSIPGSWALKYDTGAATTTNSRCFIATKPYASEGSVSFTQSAASAYGFQLALISRDIGNSGMTSGESAGIAKVSNDSDLIACRLTNFAENVTGREINDFTMDGETIFDSGSAYYYIGNLGFRSSVPAGPVSATTADTDGRPEDRRMFLAEIYS